MKPLFIVFEGIDGSGTSTQASLLRSWFAEQGRQATVTSEPSPGPIGNLIREGMKGRVLFASEQTAFDHQMAYLFAADRHDHLYNPVDGVYALMQRDINVISTRYYFSSFAYHCTTPEDLILVTNLNSRFPKPDIVIYIDNPVAVSVERLGHRGFRDAYENESKLARVKDRYEQIFATYDDHMIRVKGDDAPGAIHQEIVDSIKNLEYEHIPGFSTHFKV